MRCVRACAAIAIGISAALLLSACAGDVTAPPVASVPAPPPPPAPPQRLGPPPPGQAQAEIAGWLAAAGYKPFQVAALIEHARVESGFRPCAAGPGGLRYTFQWGGTRLQRLQQFAHTSGCPRLDTQLAFADRELRDDPKYACFWAATTERAAYAALRRGFGGGSC